MIDDTVPATIESASIVTGYELVITRGDQSTTFAVCNTQLSVGSADKCDLRIDDSALQPQHLRLVYGNGILTFFNLHQQAPVLLNGSECLTQNLQHQDELQIGEVYIQVLHSSPNAYLEGLSNETRGQIFSLSAPEILVGRPGQRKNDIEIQHATVSRSHARLIWKETSYQLQSQTKASSTRINGRLLASEEAAELRHGDIVFIGDLLFCFRLASQEKSKGGDTPKIRIFSLGGFTVMRGNETISERAFKAQSVRNLLSYMVVDPGPQPVDKLMELFWPDSPPQAARKNLNWATLVLRKTLGSRSEGGPDFVTRDASLLQINPKLDLWHDLWEMEKHKKQAHELITQDIPTALEHWAQVFALYRGNFLEGSYEDWAVVKRETISQELIRDGCQAAGAAFKIGQFEQAVMFANHVLAIEPCSQEAALVAMRANIEKGSPELAVRVYETITKKLAKELDLEPSTDLVREHTLAKMKL